MSNGMAVYDSSGSVVWDTDGILARIVGNAVITFNASEFGIKTATVTGMVSTDLVIVFNADNPEVVYTVSVAGSVISINRTNAYSGNASTHNCLVLRR